MALRGKGTPSAHLSSARQEEVQLCWRSGPKFAAGPLAVTTPGELNDNLSQTPWAAPHLRGLDSDAAFLLILTSVSEARLPGPRGGDDARLAHEGVGERGLAVVHVSDDRHVSDVGFLVHDGTDLIYCEVHLWWGKGGQADSGNSAWQAPAGQ